MEGAAAHVPGSMAHIPGAAGGMGGRRRALTRRHGPHPGSGRWMEAPPRTYRRHGPHPGSGGWDGGRGRTHARRPIARTGSVRWDRGRRSAFGEHHRDDAHVDFTSPDGFLTSGRVGSAWHSTRPCGQFHQQEVAHPGFAQGVAGHPDFAGHPLEGPGGPHPLSGFGVGHEAAVQRSFLHADEHRDVAADHAFTDVHEADFHTHVVRDFSAREFAAWRRGLWRNEWHYGRRGWWWEVDGVWYGYPAPVYPYPLQVAPLTVYETPVMEGPNPEIREVAASQFEVHEGIASHPQAPAGMPSDYPPPAYAAGSGVPPAQSVPSIPALPAPPAGCTAALLRPAIFPC